MLGIPSSVASKKFAIDLKNEINDDNVSNGAAALAFYSLLAIFPALIFMLSILPFLPIANLQQAVLDFMHQAMPGDAANLLGDTVSDIIGNKKGSLLAFGTVATIWAASSGIIALMQQLNITYDVKESRSFIKQRLVAIGLMFAFGALMIIAFALIVLGGHLQDWLGAHFGVSQAVLFAFAAIRWVIIVLMILLSFAIMYYWAPDVDQKFSFITPGSIIGTAVLAAASLAFNFYVARFADYNATYGSIGAVIILMMWLYVMGLVILLGSEINSLAEHYSPEGKQKGEKVEGDRRRPAPPPGRQPSPQPV